MNVLIGFVIPALLVSGTALLALRLTPAAPPGIRLALAFGGLFAWLVPWSSISLPPLFSLVPAAAGWAGERSVQLSTIRQDLVTTVDAAVPVVPVAASWWLVVFVPGLIWFAADLRSYAATVRRWKRGSRCGRELGRLLPGNPRGRLPPIRIVADSSAAAVAGILRPTIYIGERIAERRALRTALTHEWCHARRRDPFWLTLVMLIARLYCFNPLVLALRREAVLAIEAGCDECCARLLGRREYRGTLARLALEGQGRDALSFAPTLQTPSLNLARLRLLELGPRVDARALGAVLAVLAASLGGLAWGRPGPTELRIGAWLEVADSSHLGYDMPPGLRRFERLPGGMTRAYAADGTTGSTVDFRCDGRDYPIRADGAGPASTFACTAVDRWTNRYVTKRTDGSGIVTDSTESVSPDGKTLELFVNRPDAGQTTGTRRTFSRLQ